MTVLVSYFDEKSEFREIFKESIIHHYLQWASFKFPLSIQVLD